ncbi:hypothetical protein PINS_up022414 [Pythium insidiosum]|nr:hypothetical protein PINS_up022414 [Pythium insidiosum]
MTARSSSSWTSRTSWAKAASKSDAQLWLFDSAKKNIISKWNGECLDGYEAKENGAVHMWGCNGGDNQKWTYNAGEKRFHKATNTDYCLAYGSGKKLVVKRCNGNDASQTFVFGSGRVNDETRFGFWMAQRYTPSAAACEGVGRRCLLHFC